MRENPTDKTSLIRKIFLVALFATAIDALVGFAFNRLATITIWHVLVPLGLTTVAFLVLATVVLISAALIARPLNLGPNRVTTAFSFWMIALFAMLSFGNDITFHPVLEHWIIWVVDLIIATGGAIGIYFALKQKKEQYYGSGPFAKLVTGVLGLMVIALVTSPILFFFFRPNPSPNANSGAAQPPIKHVIFLTVDTLRADALSCYSGSKGAPTPNIESLSRDGIQFAKAFAPAPWTVPSFVSIMTGLSPQVHLATEEDSKIPDTIQTLADYMTRSGYFTVAIGKNPMLVPTNIGKGFDRFTWFPRYPFGHIFGARLMKKAFSGVFPFDASTKEVTDISEQWILDHKDSPFFLWVHYLDPHQPYCPPTAYAPPDTSGSGLGNCFSQLIPTRLGFFYPNAAQRERIKKLYLAEVRYVDDGIGRLVNALKKAGIYNDALVVFLSDHGEEFWEHGGFEHGHTVYNELIRVPLIIKLPQYAQRSKRIGQNVDITSVMPTTLDLCGIAYDPKAFSVKSLSGLWSGNENASASSPIISSGNLYYEKQESIIDGDFKYIHKTQTGREELYFLKDDLDEQNPLFDSEKLAELRQKLDQLTKQSENLRARMKHFSAMKGKLDPHLIQEMKSLGYIQ